MCVIALNFPKVLSELKCVVSVNKIINFNSINKTLPQSSNWFQLIAPPLISSHWLGQWCWARLAKCSNKQSNVLTAPQSHSVSGEPNKRHTYSCLHTYSCDRRKKLIEKKCTLTFKELWNTLRSPQDKTNLRKKLKKTLKKLAYSKCKKKKKKILIYKDALLLL